MSRARGLVLAVLGGLVVASVLFGTEWLDRGGSPSAAPMRWTNLELDPPGGLLAEGPLLVSDRVVAALSSAPTQGPWERLARTGALRPLRLELSGDVPAPTAFDPPSRLREGRRAAGRLRVGDGSRTPAPGADTIHPDADAMHPDADPIHPEADRMHPEAVLVRDETGVADTAWVPSEFDGDGSVELPLLFDPVRSGWTRWEIEAVPDGGIPSVSWWGWVEEARPLRVLVLSGAPTSESRFAVRALEEAGEDVETWIHLGRGVWVGRERDARLPVESDAEAEYASRDVVMVFPGIDASDEEREALERAVRDGGLGLLHAGGATLPGVEGSPTGFGDPAASRELRWDVIPVEIPALPPPPFEVAVPGGAPLVVWTEGFGRRGVMPLSESWRWRMESGAEAEHRAFWKGLAGWLAGGVVTEPSVEVVAGASVPGVPIRLRWGSSRPPDEHEGLRIEAADGAFEIPLGEADEVPGGWEASALWASATEGLYRVRSAAAGSERPGAWVRLGPGGASTDTGLDPVGEAARRALRSPEGAVLGPDTDARRRAEPRGARPGRWWTWGLFLLLGVPIVMEWALRRRRGLS